MYLTRESSRNVEKHHAKYLPFDAEGLEGMCNGSFLQALSQIVPRGDRRIVDSIKAQMLEIHGKPWGPFSLEESDSEKMQLKLLSFSGIFTTKYRGTFLTS